jgi:hypothetical protein
MDRRRQTTLGKLFPADNALTVIDGDDTAQEHHHADDQPYFAAGNAGGAGIVGTAGDRPIIELDQAEEDKRERPPVAQHFLEIQATVVVEQEKKADD